MMSALGLRLQGLALAIVFAALAGFAVRQAALPMLNSWTAIEDTRSRVANFSDVVNRPGQITVLDTTELVASDVSVDERGRAVQRLLVQLANERGVRVQRLSMGSAELLEGGVVRLPFDLELIGDLEHWTTYLEALADVRPALFVENARMSRSTGPRPDVGMSLRLRIAAYAAPKEPGA